MQQSELECRELPPEFGKLRTVWRRYRTGWRACHYSLGIAATIATIAAASIPSYLPNYPVIVMALSSFSAISIALVSFLLPSRKAKAYSEAWRILNDACLKYIFKSDGTVNDLINAVAEGEELVRTSDPL